MVYLQRSWTGARLDAVSQKQMIVGKQVAGGSWYEIHEVRAGPIDNTRSSTGSIP